MIASSYPVMAMFPDSCGRQRQSSWGTFLLVLVLHGAALALMLKVLPDAVVSDSSQVMQASWVAVEVVQQPEPDVRPRPLPTRQYVQPTAEPTLLAATNPQPSAEPMEQTAPESSPPAAAPTATVPVAQIPINPPRFDADYLSNPAPAYPAASRAMGEQGKVYLRVFVSPHGDAEEVLLRTSSGFERLDQAALDAVRHWKFVPARKGEEAVAAWVVVPILFNLRR